MERYVKKPIVIEAVRLIDPQTPEEIAGWCHGRACGVGWVGMNQWIEIDTLEGVMRANYGDWIIKGISGEFYPCKPDIFEETYDLVDSPEQPVEVGPDLVQDYSGAVRTDASAVDDLERNPAHYCFGCDNFIGHRGFCSQECHDNHYDAELETLEILSDKDCMAGIRKSMEQINNGESIPLSELYPEKHKKHFFVDDVNPMKDTF